MKIDVAMNISNFMYADNLQATKELMELFDSLTDLLKTKPSTYEEYVNIYDDHFCTFTDWNSLVESESYCDDGLTEEECKDQLNKTIFQLPCGWYVQYT